MTFLLFILNANWGGTATSETFLGEGKTDILLRWRDRDAFIGECKFWKGEKAFTDGLDQLLGRYTVWRATRVALLLFIRDRVDISATIEKAKSAIDQHPRFIGVADSTASNHAAFLMKAQHDSQKVVTLTLLPIVIPQEAHQTAVRKHPGSLPTSDRPMLGVAGSAHGRSEPDAGGVSQLGAPAELMARPARLSPAGQPPAWLT